MPLSELRPGSAIRIRLRRFRAWIGHLGDVDFVADTVEWLWSKRSGIQKVIGAILAVGGTVTGIVASVPVWLLAFLAPATFSVAMRAAEQLERFRGERAKRLRQFQRVGRVVGDVQTFDRSPIAATPPHNNPCERLEAWYIVVCKYPAKEFHGPTGFVSTRAFDEMVRERVLGQATIEDMLDIPDSSLGLPDSMVYTAQRKALDDIRRVAGKWGCVGFPD